jgi:hypothetical protein
MLETERIIRFVEIPIGKWALDGRWYPYDNIDMSTEDQIKWNKAGGNLCPLYPQHNAFCRCHKEWKLPEEYGGEV